MFNAPSAVGETLPVRDLVGRLLIIRPAEYIDRVTTTNGIKDAVRVDLVDLDNPDPTTNVHRDVLWFNAKVVGALKRQLGDLVLARVTVGPGKPGQNPPYILTDATEDPAAVARANAWTAANPGFAAGVAPPAPAPAATYAPPPAAPAYAPPPPAALAAPPAAPAPQIPAALMAQLDPQTRALYDQLAAQQTNG